MKLEYTIECTFFEVYIISFHKWSYEISIRLFIQVSCDLGEILRFWQNWERYSFGPDLCQILLFIIITL